MELDAPGVDFVFVHVQAKDDEDGDPKVTLVPGYLKPPPLT